jgi:hypothetical protein
MSMKTTKRIPSQVDATGEQQLAGFIKKFDSKNAALIRSVRKVLRERLPTANELVYDNYNFFVIGYCSTERPSDCVLSIAAAGANGVGLSCGQDALPVFVGALLIPFSFASISLLARDAPHSRF